MGKLSVADNAKRCLDDAITYIAENRTEYVHNPDSDFTRERKLNMGDTMWLILSMDGGSLAKELHEHFAISNVKITPSGFVQQRSKIKSDAFYALLRHYNKSEIAGNHYKGYRVLAVDSSAINQPRDPELDSFMNTSTFPHGLNQTQMSALYDVLNKTVLDVDLRPRPKMNEQAAMIEMLKRNDFHSKSIILMDRGYEGYNLFAHLIEKGNVDFLCRVRSNNGGMRIVKNLPMKELDCVCQLETA